MVLANSSQSSISEESFKPGMKLETTTNEKVFSVKRIATDPVVKQGKRTVRFADTQGLSLTSTLIFPTNNSCSIIERRRTTKHFEATGWEYGKVLNFRSPIHSVTTKEAVRQNNLSLKKIVCNETGIHGTIQVRNVAYEKEVSVRLTYNAWKSYQDVSANYSSTSSGGEIDKFRFHITYPKALSHITKVELAVCYKVNGQQYWDNNFGDNYRLVIYT